MLLADDAAIQIVRARPEELADLLRRSLSSPQSGEAERDALATLLMHHSEELGLSLDQSWWCLRRGKPVSACTCIESPGRTAMLFLQPVDSNESNELAAAELVSVVTEEVRRRGMILLQCLVMTDDEPTERAMRRAGYRVLADLIYLEADTASEPARRFVSSIASDAACEWEWYRQSEHEHWLELIDATYQGTMDCPGLTDLRDTADVMEGYRTSGRFDPRRWLLLRTGRMAIGCILLMENVLQPLWEVSYMGVRVEHRHRGIGRILLARGLDLAHHAGASKVRLAVDAANDPALKLYLSAGFTEVMRRRAMILPLSTTSKDT